jgi:putative tricarboxylic transport membrane protein
MRKAVARATPEFLTVVTILIVAAAALVFLGSLVAPPKLLFGRALTAITPSLFPSIVLAALSVMCVIQLFVIRSGGPAVGESMQALSPSEWQRGLAFFAIMLGYALTMAPFGFLISSAIAMALMSVLMGSRSIPQIICVAAIGPALLYLAATRLLAVSLPELHFLEIFYARLLGE